MDRQVIVHVDDNTVYTAISVIDFGKGISPKEQKHILSDFIEAALQRKTV